MNTTPSLDLRRLVDGTRRRLARRRRVEGLLEGLALGAAGAGLAASWQAAVDPAFPWLPVAVVVATAGFLPYLVHAGRVRVSAEQAVWYLDRRSGAGGRLLALAEDGGAFRESLEREVEALALERARSRHLRAGRRALWLGAALAGLVFVRLLAPAVPPGGEAGSDPVADSPAARAASLAGAADRLAAALAERGEGRLADGLANAAPRLRRGAAGGASTARLARTVEDRLRREEHRIAIRRALGETPEGRTLAARLTGSGGEGAAMTEASPAAAAQLDRAAAEGTLSPELRRQLARAAAAMRRGDEEAFAAAASAVRDALGTALSPDLLAEASELLASLDRGDPAPAADPSRGGEKPRNGARRVVREPGTTELVFDPDLRRVIRRYFERGGPIERSRHIERSRQTERRRAENE